MPSFCHFVLKTAGISRLALLLVCVAGTVSLDQGQSAAIHRLRWAEGEPGCTFSADDDGKYRYGLWTNDVGIILAVDSQELQKAARRTEPIFTLFLTVHYRGQDSLSLEPGAISLEFVEHYHDTHPTLDPGVLASHLQNQSETFARKIEGEVRKHPEKHDEKQADLQAHLKDVGAMKAFLSDRSLRAATLDRTHPDAAGWIYFAARNRWVGEWKKREEFVLRIPLQDRVVEFPFALPPSAGDLILRHRTEP